MTSGLSQADVARLLTQPSPEVRAELATKVASELDNPRLTAEELSIAHDIARAMARDVADTVRHALAQNLRTAKHVPRDVAQRLARDIEQVALPILTDSPALADEDLLSLLQNADPARQRAIAERENLSEDVSHALINDGHESAVVTLLRNHTARIAEPSLHRAVDRFPGNEVVQAGIAHRPSLPLTVAERLVVIVSEELQRYLLANHELPAQMATDLVLQSRERAIHGLSLLAGQRELEKLTREMHRNGRLTPSLVLRALCMGDLPFFEASLAVLAGVPVANADILVRDPGGKGLASLYRKADLPECLLPVFRTAVNAVKSTGLDGGERDIERYRGRVITRILSQCDDFAPDDLDYLISRLGDVLTPEGGLIPAH